MSAIAHHTPTSRPLPALTDRTAAPDTLRQIARDAGAVLARHLDRPGPGDLVLARFDVVDHDAVEVRVGQRLFLLTLGQSGTAEFPALHDLAEQQERFMALELMNGGFVLIDGSLCFTDAHALIRLGLDRYRIDRDDYLDAVGD